MRAFARQRPNISTALKSRDTYDLPPSDRQGQWEGGRDFSSCLLTFTAAISFSSRSRDAIVSPVNILKCNDWTKRKPTNLNHAVTFSVWTSSSRFTYQISSWINWSSSNVVSLCLPLCYACGNEFSVKLRKFESNNVLTYHFVRRHDAAFFCNFAPRFVGNVAKF